MTAKWIKVELSTTDGSKAIDSFSEIDGLTGDVYSMCASNRQHVRYTVKKARNNSSKRAVQMCIFMSIPSGR